MYFINFCTPLTHTVLREGWKLDKCVPRLNFNLLQSSASTVFVASSLCVLLAQGPYFM